MPKSLHLHILLLALLWIPLSQHCALQSTGLLQLKCESGFLEHNTQSGRHDGTCSFENTSLKTASSYRKNINVSSHDLTYYDAPKINFPEKQILVSSFEYRRPELLNSWVFLYGLSKPARAPDAVC